MSHFTGRLIGSIIATLGLLAASAAGHDHNNGWWFLIAVLLSSTGLTVYGHYYGDDPKDSK